MYAGSALVSTLTHRGNPQPFRACAQAGCLSTQVIHRVLHRMAVQLSRPQRPGGSELARDGMPRQDQGVALSDALSTGCNREP